ncbi:MAG: HD domain-containing protein [Candidatus Dojkabacteria bacterium]|nr:HD domain-containing protein [Candidatus Dojkabacteria bacterium]MDQ7021143.1 HD domain-containing protein [Candidatus Dojkabacteria bacterium]
MKIFNSDEIKTYSELEEILLSNRIEYDLVKIKKSYQLAEAYYHQIKRRSGELLINHVLTVAAYVARLDLDTSALIASILHEAVIIRATDIDEIDSQFGTDVAFIIDGMTDMKNQTATFSEHNEVPENFRKLVLAAAEDIRILIIRLANKYHNLKTLQYLPEESQINQAKKN